MPSGDQFAAAQTASALEPAAGVVEGGEDGDSDVGADREAEQGGVEEVADHALAQGEQRPVVGDGAVSVPAGIPERSALWLWRSGMFPSTTRLLRRGQFRVVWIDHHLARLWDRAASWPTLHASTGLVWLFAKLLRRHLSLSLLCAIIQAHRASIHSQAFLGSWPV